MTRFVLFMSSGASRVTATSEREYKVVEIFKALKERLLNNSISVIVSSQNAFGCIDTNGIMREIKYERYTFDSVDPYNGSYTL